MKKPSLVVLLLILLIFIVSFPQIELTKAQDNTIYIRSNGTVEGTDKIQREGNVFTFIENVVDQSIIIEKDNIILDGDGYSLEGQLEETGILVEGRNNVTVSNLTIQNFNYGIYFSHSSSNYILNNKILNNDRGIEIEYCSENWIKQNQISGNIDFGFYAFESSDNVFRHNTVVNNENGVNLIFESNTLKVGVGIISNCSIKTNDVGISLFFGPNIQNEVEISAIDSCDIKENNIGIKVTNFANTSITPLIYENNITNNNLGIYIKASLASIQFNNIDSNEIGIEFAGSENQITHNNFIDNSIQVYDFAWDNPDMASSVNIWFEGDTGNYWSDYTGTGTTPYVIDEKNQDNFPATKQFTIPIEPFDPNTDDMKISNMFWSLVIIAIILSSGFIAFSFWKNKTKKQNHIKEPWDPKN